MLIWNVKQYEVGLDDRDAVVIWCLFEMWNSKIRNVHNFPELWFDAYLKCETVMPA